MNKAATGGHCFPACVQTFSIYINLNDTILKPEKEKKQFLEGFFLAAAAELAATGW